MKTHYLKIWPQYYAETAQGEKFAQLRKNDRNYQIGDRLVLQEYDPKRSVYTGLEITCHVTDLIEKCEGLMDGFCILSIKLGHNYSAWCPENAGKAELANPE